LLELDELFAAFAIGDETLDRAILSPCLFRYSISSGKRAIVRRRAKFRKARRRLQSGQVGKIDSRSV